MMQPKEPRGWRSGEKAVWVMGLKKLDNFTEKDYQTRLFCFFFGRCKKEKEEMDGVPNMMFNSKQTNKLKTAIY